jgi:hypothetical protein
MSMSPETPGFQPEAAATDVFLQQHGLEDIADLRVEAHGGVFSVKEAITECPPFMEMISSFAQNLEGIPNKEEILKKTITNMATSAVVESPAAKKKLN